MRYSFFKILGAVLLGTLFFGVVSCEKEDSVSDPGPDKDSSSVIDYSKHKIYASFYYKDLNKANGNFTAAYWHNDSIVVLSDTACDAYANAIFVDGEDVYVAGMSNNVAVYWKNGVEIALPQGTAASSIFVKDGVVYVCGYNGSLFGDVPMCWIDGTPIELKEGKRANSIFVSGNGTIYIAGYGVSVNSEDVIYYWAGKGANVANNSFALRGTKVGNVNNPTSASGIAATDDDSIIIVCGVETDNKAQKFYAKQWTNRRGYNLTLGENGTEARAVYVDGRTFYVAGKEARTACYWKSNLKSDNMTVDNKPTMTVLSDGNIDTYASSIYVKEKTVYVTGYEADPVRNKPLLWRNGNKIKFIDSESLNYDVTTSGVFVTKKDSSEN